MITAFSVWEQMAVKTMIVPWLKCQRHFGGKWPEIRENIFSLWLQIPTRPRHLCKTDLGRACLLSLVTLTPAQHAIQPAALTGSNTQFTLAFQKLLIRGRPTERRVNLDTRIIAARVMRNEVSVQRRGSQY